MARPNYRQNETAKINRIADKKKRKCVIEDCDNFSINSHLLQRNGLLNNISVDSHLIERKLIDPNKFVRNESPFEFKRVGLKNAFSLSLFCSKHDLEIFEPIENPFVNFKTHQSHLLLSYRVTLAEIRKKDIAIDKFQGMLDSKVLDGKFDRSPLESTIKGFEYGINDLRFFQNLIESELESNKNNFVFHIYSYPMKKIYASALFSPDKTFSFDSENPNIPYEQIYIHILPIDNELLIICGYHKDYQNRFVRKYVKKWANLNSKKLGIRLTKLFCDRIENWGLSPEVYEFMDSEKLKKFNVQAKSTVYFPDLLSSNLNIFESEKNCTNNVYKNSVSSHKHKGSGTFSR
jgi:hypothetical protein